MWIAGVPLRDGNGRKALSGGLSRHDDLGAAYMFYTSARYTLLQAYKPVILQVPTIIKGKSPPIERAATSSHATTSLERSSDRI